MDQIIRKPRKRTEITLKEKIEILDKITVHRKEGFTHSQLATLLERPKSTIVHLMKQEPMLRREWLFFCASGNQETRKRLRGRKRLPIEDALKEWCSAMLEKGEKLSGPIVKAKAEEFAVTFQCGDFKASDGWLSRWKARNNIKYKKVDNVSVPILSEDVHDRDDTLSLLPFQNFVPHFESDNSNLNNLPSTNNVLNSEVKNEQNLVNVSNYEDRDAEQIANKSSYDKNGGDTTKDLDNQSLQIISDDHARVCIADLQRFFSQKGNEDSPQVFLNMCVEYINAKHS